MDEYNLLLYNLIVSYQQDPVSSYNPSTILLNVHVFMIIKKNSSDQMHSLCYDPLSQKINVLIFTISCLGFFIPISRPFQNPDSYRLLEYIGIFIGFVLMSFYRILCYVMLCYFIIFSTILFQCILFYFVVLSSIVQYFIVLIILFKYGSLDCNTFKYRILYFCIFEPNYIIFIQKGQFIYIILIKV